MQPSSEVRSQCLYRHKEAEMRQSQHTADAPGVAGTRRFGAVHCDYEFSGISAPSVAVTFAENWNFVFWEESWW